MAESRCTVHAKCLCPRGFSTPKCFATCALRSHLITDVRSAMRSRLSNAAVPPSVSGIEEQSVHLSRAAIERRIYHPNGEISSTKIGIRIACAHIDRMSKVRGQQKNEPKVRSYHNVLRRRS
jgi:hypothetical protein